MALLYNNINVSVNNSNIVAESVNITETSPQKPIFMLNNKLPYSYVPSKVQSNISISYLMEPSNEPGYQVITGLLFDRSTPISSIVGIGSVYMTGYLSSYSFQLTPNSLVKVNAQYDVFYPVTGNLANQNSGDSSVYDITNSSGIAHYWSAAFYSGNNISDSKILQMDYVIDFNIIPIYGLGDNIPKQIYFDGITENINILGEIQNNLTYTGQYINSVFQSLGVLKLSNISSTWNNTNNSSIYISMTGFIMEEMSTTINTNSLVFFNTKLNRYS